MMGTPSSQGLPPPSRLAWLCSVVAMGFQEQQEAKPGCMRALHVAACVTLATVLLAKASHVTKFGVIVGGSTKGGS